MQVIDLGLGGVVEVIPRKHEDSRGFFAETYQRQRFAAAGLDRDWVQDNQTHSVDRGVLRGLHLQVAPFAQDKLIRVLQGSIFDVVVDVRPGSATYGKWVSCILSAERFNQLLVPKGFAHGFLTLQPHTSVLYKVSAGYAPDCERSILWSDPDLAIAWPLDLGQLPLLSPKDAAAPRLAEFASTIMF